MSLKKEINLLRGHMKCNNDVLRNKINDTEEMFFKEVLKLREKVGELKHDVKMLKCKHLRYTYARYTDCYGQKGVKATCIGCGKSVLHSVRDMDTKYRHAFTTLGLVCDGDFPRQIGKEKPKKK